MSTLNKNQILRRKRQFRSQLILLNSAVALIIIMIVLVVKVVSLNGQEAINQLEMASEDTTSGDKKKVEEKKATEASKESKADAVEAVTIQSVGEQKWIRKNLDASKPMVALTFDDGPYTPVTKRIIKTLKKYDQKATFFCVANRISRYPQVVKDAYAQGCQIASHTYGHVVLTKLKKKKIKEQVDRANNVFQGIIGCEATVLRPPGGHVNQKVRNTVDDPLICWNVDSEDWKSRNAKSILSRCNNIKDGDIVLFHDLYSSTAKAVEKLVPKLKKKGFLLVTIDELFYYKGIALEPGKVYYSAH